MINDIRKETCIIIRKHGNYLGGKKMMSDELKWTWSRYEAWRTRDREKAERVARATGGIMVLFNPIINEIKVLGA